MARYPIYAPGGHFVGYTAEADIETIPGARAIRNKRGHITKVLLPDLICIVRAAPHRYGFHTEQALDGFTIHALSGTTGNDGKRYEGRVEKRERDKSRSERDSERRK